MASDQPHGLEGPEDGQETGQGHDTEGDGMGLIERSPGHDLYREWIDAPGTDAAEKEWHPMNPAVKERWEKLAVRVGAHRGVIAALREMRRDLHAVGHPIPLADCVICKRWDERITALTNAGGQ